VSGSSYAGAGVRDQGGALAAVLRHLGPSLEPSRGRVLTGFGHYAAVIELRSDLALALCTDGVGSKTVVAAMLDRYDTIGFDCVAMNVNDLLCVGARPLAMVDYLGVHTLDERRVEGILEGLGRAAREAGIAVPGGEIAQLPEVIGTEGDERAFDLVGTCVGTLHPSALVTGARIAPGDALVGLESTGLHANGYTLARRALFATARYRPQDRPPGLERSLGEELLTPTAICVSAIEALWEADIDTRGLAHVTGDGLTNLCRLNASVGWVIEHLPPRRPILDLVQRAGDIAEEEMFRVFNMGVGFVVVVPEGQAAEACAIVEAHGHGALRLGYVSDDPGRVVIMPAGLVGSLSEGTSRLVPA
jgi:phosphoribosylformylglycinamidine cyclo-ligase